MHSLKSTAPSTRCGGPKVIFLLPFPLGVLWLPSPATVFSSQSNGLTLRLQDRLRQSGL